MRSCIGILLIPLFLYLSANCQENITAMEYYIDTDPGIGNGTSITISAGTPQDVDFTISTAALSIGFHLLVVRAQDASGDWGIQQSRAFYVSPSAATTTASITEFEYFFDTDPGVGNATSITLIPSTTIDLDDMISTAALSDGFHELFIRAKDDDNVWGIQQSRAFYISGSSVTSTALVTEFEYFFDTDPGVGNGTSITLTPSTTIDLDDMISTAALSDGFHELFVRAKDDDNAWGIQQSRAFYLSAASTTSSASITQLEYFFDTDPGIGNGTPITVTASGTINVDELLTISSLSDGFHELFVRAQDDRGNWGVQKSRVFYIDNLTQSAPSSISSVEYFIDTDPGFGAGTQVSISPPEASIDLDLTIATSSLPDGNYVLGMRVGDTNGEYSLTENASFVICTGATVDFSATTVCAGSATEFTDLSTGTVEGATYSWDFDNNGTEDDATVGSTSFTYPSAGTYTAVLTIDQLSCPSTMEITVVVEGIPTVDAGPDQTVSSGTATLAASTPGAGETGVWSIEQGTGTISDVNNPTATISDLTATTNVLRWTVTTDGAGCSAFDELTITVTEPLSEETDILSLDLVNVTETVVIDATSHTVDVEVPIGTVVTSLTPTITVSAGATISPTGPQDFSVPVIYTVVAENGTTTQDWTVTIEESDAPLGVGDLAEIDVYPNPTHSKLFISGLMKTYTVSMIDLAGKKIDFGENIQEIVLSDFAEGIYMLKIEVEDGRHRMVRIVKKN